MIGNKKVLCVVTARAGSKGIKGKNYKDLLGKPLFMWSVLAAMESKYIDRIVVSSNCAEVYAILSKFVDPIIDKRSHLPVDKRWEAGSVPFFIQRPDEISGDLSKNEEALIHALNFYKDRGGSEYDVVINLQPTSPCRFSGLLDRCIEAYHEGGYDSLLTAKKYTPFFWQKIDGKWEYIDRYFSIANVKKLYQSKKEWQMVKSFDDCCNRKMRQELKGLDEDTSDFLLHDCGSVFIVNSEVLLKTGCRIGNNPCVFEIDKLNSLQIDTEFDFELIETMLKMRDMDSPIGEVSY